MKIQLSFDKIMHKYTMYSVQGKLIWEPLFLYSKNKQLAILSFIIEDNNKKRIECVAFEKKAEEIHQFLKDTTDEILQINYVETTANTKFVKTSHKFKLQLSNDSIVKKMKIQKYFKSKKLCVKNSKKKNKKTTHHQLSIMNWLQ